MAIVTYTQEYQDGETLLEGLVAFDDASRNPRPLVMIHHAWAGRDTFVASKATQLAELGYVAFAADMYGKGVLGKSPEENGKLMQPFMADRAALQRRLLAAFDTARGLEQTDPQRTAAIGFCFGGLCALDLARSGIEVGGVISFHGLLVPSGLDAKPIRAKVLVLHGHDDPMVPPEQVLALQTELTSAGADWQVHSYGNTLHAFTNPVANDRNFGTVYNSTADKRSWLSMLNFLNELFA